MTQIGPLNPRVQKKTYDSGDSPVVTHLTTNPPILCLYRDDRTGILALKVRWSYVIELENCNFEYTVSVSAGAPVALAFAVGSKRR